MTTTDQENATVDWQLELAGEVDMADWLWVPPDLTGAERSTWLEGAEATVSDLVRAPDGPPPDRGPIRRMLEASLEIRETSPSALIFLVCPLLAPVGTLCHVMLLPSSGDEPWPEEEGAVVQAISGAQLGEGVQLSTTRTVEEDGASLELASVHLVFDDGTTALVLSLQEGPAPLVAAAMPGLALLNDTISLVRGEERFRAPAPSWLPVQETWDTEEAR
jgi:hypothetical protein